jgi:hypothetical protein
MTTPPPRSTISEADLPPLPKPAGTKRPSCSAPTLPTAPPRPSKPAAAPATTGRPRKGAPAPIISLSTPEFLAQELPEPTWLVPDLMTAGLAIVAGPPKVGKTWLLIQLAIASALGLPFLGKDLEPTNVLYVSLEGNVSFLQKRVRTLCGDEAPENLRWCFDIDRLHQGLERQVEEYLTNFPGTTLVIIDTLVRVNPLNSGRRTQYQEDADTLRPVEMLAQQWPETTFLFVHHTRECKAEDPLDGLAGSRGLTGTIDNAWVLTKQQNVDADGVLACRGRNLPGEDNLALTFDKKTCRWELKGDATKFIGGETRQAIHTALEVAAQNGEEGLTPAALARDTGITSGTIRSSLSRMVASGQVINNRGTYTLPADSMPSGGEDTDLPF